MAACLHTPSCARCAARAELKTARKERNHQIEARRAKKRAARRAATCNITVRATEAEATARWHKGRAKMGWPRQDPPVGMMGNRPCSLPEVAPGSRACAEHLPDAICTTRKKLGWHLQHAAFLTDLIATMNQRLRKS